MNNNGKKSLKRICFLSSLPLIVLLPGVFRQTLAQVPSSLVANKANRIIETPVAASSDKPNTYYITALPASPNDVHLFLRGVELAQGRDYLLADRTLTLLGVAPGAALQSLRVLYQTQFVPNATTGALQRDEQAILSGAMMRMAMRDGKTLDVRQEYTEQTSLTGTASPPLVTARSLQEIAQRVREARVKPSEVGTRSKKSYSSPTKGVDGLGDSFASADYMNLLGAAPSAESRSVADPNATTTGRARSLVLIQRKIDEGGSR